MPSIRRSLIAYFLLLLGLALAAVGGLVHQIAGGALRDRETIAAERIEQEYKTRCARAEQQFNEALETQAAALGREFRYKTLVLTVRERAGEFEDWDRRTRLGIQSLALVGGTSRWHAYLSGTLASYDRRFFIRNPLYWHLQRQYFDDLLRQWLAEDASHHPHYFQFHSSRTRPAIRGPNGELPPLPPADELTRHLGSRSAWVDEVVADGVLVRRVIVQAPIVGMPPRGRIPDPARLPPSVHAVYGGPFVAVPPTAFLDRGFDPLPYVYVQVARPRADLEAELQRYDQQRQDALRTAAEETRTAMTGLRRNLLGIAGLSFAALAVGGWWLVGRGVAPLRKLSDAVSRVSERDFRLPVQAEDLSHELLPIHSRLTDTLDALRRAFEREKQAVADISHELRTPIAALLTTVEVSLRKLRTAEQYRATLEECREIGQQLRKLVERIMTLAWLDAGQDRTIAERVDAAELAHGCATVIRSLAEARGLHFTAAIEPGTQLVSDPDKLREVLMNLLHNAVEYNVPDGRVELRVRPTRGQVLFEVQDTGIGMPPEIQGKIFERFFRADPSRHETGVHAGLGLAIVKEYVERLGGTIQVESAPGVGSTFRVSLAVGEMPREGSDGSYQRSPRLPSAPELTLPVPRR